MGSKGRVPPTHFRHVPSPGVAHPDPYPSVIRPPLGNFPPFDMLPPPEVMVQKLSAQHIEIEKLANENRRLASTQGTLRQDLATANHDLQLVHAHIAEVKAKKEQQMRGMVDKMSAMESELKAAGSIKADLQKARGEAQGLLATRQELISKAQQLNRDLQMAHAEAQQIPSLMAELDGLRREYEHSRANYEYEKKLYSDHLESLQVMEKNYMAMSREVEKLRSELTNSANFDPRTAMQNAGGPYSGSAGYSEGVPKGNYSSGQNAYGIGQQGQGPHPGGGSGGMPGPMGNSLHVLPQSAPYAPRGPIYGLSRGATGYDPHRGPAGAGYDAQRVQTGPNYDAQRGGLTGPGYNAHKGHEYEAQRGHISDSQNVHGYNGQNPPHDPQRGSGDDAQRVANYDTQKGGVGPQGQVPMNNAPYGSAPSARGGSGNESIPQGGNLVRR